MTETYRTLREWKAAGPPLANCMRRDVWAIGDWWIGGAAFGLGVRKEIVTTPGWEGPGYDCCRAYAAIARRFPPALRYINADFSHYQVVAPLEDNELALDLLTQAAREAWSVNVLRIKVDRIRHFREITGNDVADDFTVLIRDIQSGQRRKFRGLLVAPPWQMSWDSTGRRGASGTYYKLMELNDLLCLPVPQVADNRAFLFLWVPGNLLESGLQVLQAWGFSYTQMITWDRLLGFGKGSYVRVASEQLLTGRMPDAPRRFDDNSISSMLRVQRRGHSEKPDETHGIVQRATAGPYLELFARKRVPGWTCCGNQIEPPDQAAISGTQPDQTDPISVHSPTDGWIVAGN